MGRGPSALAAPERSTTNRYFRYDAMNRQTVVDAVDAAGNIYGAEVGQKALKRYEKK